MEINKLHQQNTKFKLGKKLDRSHSFKVHIVTVQGYGDVAAVHKAAWPPQPHLLPPLDTQKPLDVKQPKPEIKLEPTDAQKRPHPEDMMVSPLNYLSLKKLRRVLKCNTESSHGFSKQRI